MNFKLLAGAACLALASCNAVTTTQPETRWKDFAQHTVDQYFALNPNDAVYQGAHRFDGKLPDWSDAERSTLAEVQAAWQANPPAWP